MTKNISSTKPALYFRNTIIPLLKIFESLGGKHISVVGSAAHSLPGIQDVQDIDIYTIVEELNYDVWRKLYQAGLECCSNFHSYFNIATILETKRGPFKPEPCQLPICQIHLLVDDQTTLLQTPEVTLLDWENNGNLLRGEKISKLRTIGQEQSKTNRLRYCVVEIDEMICAISNSAIPYREWEFFTKSNLNKKFKPLTTVWEARCLLKYALVVSKVIAQTALMPEWNSNKDSLIRTLCEEELNYYVLNYNLLDKDWEKVQKLAITHLKKLIGTIQDE